MELFHPTYNWFLGPPCSPWNQQLDPFVASFWSNRAIFRGKLAVRFREGLISDISLELTYVFGVWWFVTDFDHSESPLKLLNLFWRLNMTGAFFEFSSRIRNDSKQPKRKSVSRPKNPKDKKGRCDSGRNAIFAKGGNIMKHLQSDSSMFL